jgi:hypothetical protein
LPASAPVDGPEPNLLGFFGDLKAETVKTASGLTAERIRHATGHRL